MVIVSNPNDLVTVLENVKGIPHVIVGNYGRIAPKHGSDARKTYGNNLYAYDDEVEVFKKAISFNIPCVYQTTPEEPAENLSKVLGL